MNKTEKYGYLLIRATGYSAFFVELEENTQNEVIARTE
jgi:pyruvate-formate lyase